MNSKSFHVRIKIVGGVIVLFSFVLIAKLFFIQVVHGADYRDRADHQYSTPASDIFERGSIFATSKDGAPVTLAGVTTGFKIAVVPREITDPDTTYAALTAIVPIDRNSYDTHMDRTNDPYEEVATHLTKRQADLVSALDIPGVSIYKDKWRFYPGGSLAARTLGFLGFSGENFGGRYGLERTYENVLGASGNNPSVNFFARVFSNITSTFEDEKGMGDLVTTIEPSVQAYLDDALSDAVEKWGAESAGGIIIDPMTGAIYAMSTVPTFDLNNFSKVKNPLTFANPLVENVYELGSVVKPLTLAAGLDAGVITPSTTYEDKGFLVINTERINNFDKKGRGVIPMQEILNQSLNTGAAFVMEKLGRNRFREYMLEYGLGEKTLIDMPGEVKSLVNNLQSPRDIEYATASFGQGIALTPVAAVRAFSTLANGGYLITPHLGKSITYADDSVETLEFPVDKEAVLKKETSLAITRMLVEAFDTGLLDGKFKFEHYSVAAKTGTAQIVNPSGEYYTDQYLHSMFGYYPAYNPRFLTFMYLYNPKGVDFASNTLAYTFSDIAKFLFNYYSVPPDR